MRVPDAIKELPKKRLNHGFTLVEVMTSLAITMLIFSGVLVSYIFVGRQAVWSGYRLAAESLTIMSLEQARGAVWDATTGLNQVTNLNLNGWVWTPSGTNGAGTGTGWMTNILDVPLQATNNIIIATNFVTITLFFEALRPTVPLQEVSVSTVWSVYGFGGTRLFTNQTASYYALDSTL
jgi:hypothetical protein